MVCIITITRSGWTYSFFYLKMIWNKLSWRNNVFYYRHNESPFSENNSNDWQRRRNFGKINFRNEDKLNWENNFFTFPASLFSQYHYLSPFRHMVNSNLDAKNIEIKQTKVINFSALVTFFWYFLAKRGWQHIVCIKRHFCNVNRTRFFVEKLRKATNFYLKLQWNK